MVKFSETYLFKIHALSNALDKAFDMTLREHADLTLSQFVLILAISQHKTINQRTAAKFLGISPAAVNRQAEITTREGLIAIRTDGTGRGQTLALTKKGKTAIERGIKALDKYVFKIFNDEDTQTSLMHHIDMLLNNTKNLSAKNNTKEDSDMADIPKARKLFRGDINDAVIRVQKATGIEITPAWWNQHVGNNGTTESILDRFDKAYEQYVASKTK
jgi:DNA-binding MarR family transcriptional regulator